MGLTRLHRAGTAALAAVCFAAQEVSAMWAPQPNGALIGTRSSRDVDRNRPGVYLLNKQGASDLLSQDADNQVGSHYSKHSIFILQSFKQSKDTAKTRCPWTA